MTYGAYCRRRRRDAAGATDARARYRARAAAGRGLAAVRRAAGALRPPTEAQSRWPAPAKLNLFLHVTGRRADGYHELQTLFQLHRPGATTSARASRDDGAHRAASRGRPGLRPSRTWRCAPPGRCSAARAAAWARDIEVRKRIPLGGGPGRRQLGCRHRAAGAEPAVGLRPEPRRAGRPGAALGRGCACFRSGFFGLGGGVGRAADPGGRCRRPGT